MAYRAQFINPIFQNGKKDFTLVVEDSARKLPTIRIDKSYPDTITNLELIADAEREILHAVLSSEITIDAPAEE